MAQSLLTKESPEIRQFFRNIDTLSRLLDIQAEKFRPLLNGDRYMTDSELAGKLKLTRRTLADYRLNGKIPERSEDDFFLPTSPEDRLAQSKAKGDLCR